MVTPTLTVGVSVPSAKPQRSARRNCAAPGRRSRRPRPDRRPASGRQIPRRRCVRTGRRRRASRSPIAQTSAAPGRRPHVPSRSLICLKWSRSNRKTPSGSPSIACCANSWLRAVEEGAAVGDPAQRIDQRIDLVLQLGALLGHVEQQERHHHREEQRSEREQRERNPAHDRMVVEHAAKSRSPGCAPAAPPHRPAARSRSASATSAARRAAPELLGGGRRQHRHHGRDDDHAQIDIVGERRDAAGHQPQDRGEHDDERQHLAAVEDCARRPRSGRRPAARVRWRCRSR